MNKREKRKKENLFVAILKSLIPVAFAVLIYFLAVKYDKDIVKRAEYKRVSSIPVAAAKPILYPKEFKEIEVSNESVTANILEKSDPVGDEYFADAVFAGDSLTDGFRIYDVGQHFDVISYVGLSPRTAITQPVFKTASGEMLIMADAIKYLGSRKAYILLGTNGLNWTTPEQLIDGYSELIDQLMTVNPDTYIILQSIPPVTPATAAARPQYTQERVELYNSLVKQLAIEKGIYFLDVYSALVGENGYLMSNIAANDGMHMTPAGYKLWFEYISTHTIQGNSAFTMDSEGRIIPMKPIEEEVEEEPSEE